MIFETHAHYDDAKYSGDRADVIAAVLGSGVRPIINVGASLESTENSIKLAENYPDFYAAVGVHPDEVAELNEESFDWLKQQALHEKTVAIGEIGLDYYWTKEPEARELQKKWFARQIDLARENRLPVIVHSRDAAEDTMQVMRQCNADEIPGVIHCYSYSPEMALEWIQMGYYIGVGGVVTFKNGRKLAQTVEAIPLERILLETDCPYLAPEPNRGTRNDSRNIPYIIDKIAAIKGITAEEVERITEENAYHLFTKIPRI